MAIDSVREVETSALYSRGIRGDQSPERITRHGEHLARLCDPGRHEHTLTGQQIQLAEESAGRVAGDDAFLPVGVDDNLDGAREDDVEIVADVALLGQVFTGRHRPTNAKRQQRRQLRVVQLPEGIIALSRQGTYPFDFSAFSRATCAAEMPRARAHTTTLPEACGESVSRAPSLYRRWFALRPHGLTARAELQSAHPGLTRFGCSSSILS
jgi:hypothetical protein